MLLLPQSRFDEENNIELKMPFLFYNRFFFIVFFFINFVTPCETKFKLVGVITVSMSASVCDS